MHFNAHNVHCGRLFSKLFTDQKKNQKQKKKRKKVQFISFLSVILKYKSPLIENKETDLFGLFKGLCYIKTQNIRHRSQVNQTV